MIRVVIVDDSAVVRAFIQKVLERDGEIKIVGSAPDPFVAKELILEHDPDVITLDLQMPRMDGFTFLKKLERYLPIPVVVVSSLTASAGPMALELLASGACEVVGKPGPGFSREEMAAELVAKVKAASRANRKRLRDRGDAGGANATQGATQAAPAARPVVARPLGSSLQGGKLIALGASTGGTVALEHVLRGMPANSPPTLIVQHMPEVFTASFAARLNQLVPMEVREAQGGEILVQGLALVAPGHRHLAVRRTGGQLQAVLLDSPPVNHHRPSVDVLFDSVAEQLRGAAVGAILTGMGADGARGLLKMRQAGARTVAENEESCVVFGMPKAAIELGAAEEVTSLERIAERVLALAHTA